MRNSPNMITNSPKTNESLSPIESSVYLLVSNIMSLIWLGVFLFGIFGSIIEARYD